MRLKIPKISLRQLLDREFLLKLYLVMMCIQFVPLEGLAISNVKVTLMALAPLLFLIKTPYFSKALVWGALYWLICYFVALFHGNMRFSTLGYLGMFVIAYIFFYSLVYSNSISFHNFTLLLKYLIMAYGIVLILQQIAMILGIHYFPPINLVGQYFLSLTKLPSLAIEPSHSARILTVAMLAYIRCIEIKNGRKVLVSQLFEEEHRKTTILFLWAMLTMGSGTAFIGLGILSLYFIQRKTFVYIIPLFILLFYLGQYMGMTQLDRAVRVASATATGDVEAVQEEDGSAASRVTPLINTLKMDLTQKESWFGKGTAYHGMTINRSEIKLSVVDQYGLIALIASIIIVY